MYKIVQKKIAAIKIRYFGCNAVLLKEEKSQRKKTQKNVDQIKKFKFFSQTLGQTLYVPFPLELLGHK